MSDPIENERRMTLLPAKPGTCSECAVKHEPDEAHDPGSLFYQYSFYGRHGRWPTWLDAISHLDADKQEVWKEELRRAGVVL